MLMSEYRNGTQILIDFHNYLVPSFSKPKMFAGTTKAVGITLDSDSYWYDFGDRSAHVRVDKLSYEVPRFIIDLYNNGSPINEFRFDEEKFYDARNVLVNWLLTGEVNYTQPTFVSNRRITQIDDDKPYKDVDIAVHINSSLETMALYREYKDAKWEYKQDNGGYLHTIGYHGEMPICVSPMVHVINGVTVMYVEATSMVVDWAMVDKWIHGRCKESVLIESDPASLVNRIKCVRRNKDAEQ